MDSESPTESPSETPRQPYFFATDILQLALYPEDIGTPENANGNTNTTTTGTNTDIPPLGDPQSTTSTRNFQPLSAADRAEVSRLLDVYFPVMLPSPHPGIAAQMAALRIDVRKRAQLRNANPVEEIHNFFMELRPILNTEHIHYPNGIFGSLNPDGTPRTNTAMLNDPMDIDAWAYPHGEVEEDDEDDEDDDGELGHESILDRRRRIQAEAGGKKVARRPVEGDCTICFAPLMDESGFVGVENCERKLGSLAVSVNGGGNSIEAGGRYHVGVTGDAYDSDGADDSDGEDDEDDEDDEDEDEDEEEEYGDTEDEYDDSDDEYRGVVWCRAFCGTNYHSHCFIQWAHQFRRLRVVTCPSCRRGWA
ncbi:hypothetical protein BDW74DRAFT_20864 [Aspergillus multicolor]|uniref:uncharacterized protein n=1 Tax=Aspergillus multicolor TaxID=41759 RepID=UPI003CCD39BF